VEITVTVGADIDIRDNNIGFGERITAFQAEFRLNSVRLG
jgi:hypothetical protein